MGERTQPPVAGRSPWVAVWLTVFVWALLVYGPVWQPLHDHPNRVVEKDATNHLYEKDAKDTHPRHDHHTDLPVDDCWSDDLLTYSNTKHKEQDPSLSRRRRRRRASLDFAATAHMVRTTDPPRYDYTCPFVKARYNCAEAEAAHGTDRARRASDYTLVLQSPSSSQTNDDDTKKKKKNGVVTCHLRRWIDQLGGPSGVATRQRELQIQQQQASATTIPSPPHQQQRPVTILLHGNSLLRQVFEAIACGYSSQITRLVLTQGGQPASLAALAALGPKLLQKSDFGTLLRYNGTLTTTTGGCHGDTDRKNRKWYHPDIVPVVPHTMDGCNDNVAMVEFGNHTNHNVVAMRIYYVFRPSTYENLTDLYDLLDLTLSDVDHIVFNDHSLAQFPDHVRAQLRPGILERHSWDWDPLLRTIRTLAPRDTGGVWWGASNPGVEDPPDALHPCMPGLPDDHVRVLLFLLVRNVSLL